MASISSTFMTGGDPANDDAIGNAYAKYLPAKSEAAVDALLDAKLPDGSPVAIEVDNEQGSEGKRKRYLTPSEPVKMDMLVHVSVIEIARYPGLASSLRLFTGSYF